VAILLFIQLLYLAVVPIRFSDVPDLSFVRNLLRSAGFKALRYASTLVMDGFMCQFVGLFSEC